MPIMMINRLIATAVIFLGIGLGIGYFICNYMIENYNPDQKTTAETTEIAHETKEVPDEELIPTVELQVSADPVSGWNAQIPTTNFTFSPEDAGSEHTPGQGHAHIYIDGKKINRIYGEWYHLGKIEPGEHQVSIRLSTNDHKELLQNGAYIEDIVTINVPGADGTADDGHSDHTH